MAATASREMNATSCAPPLPIETLLQHACGPSTRWDGASKRYVYCNNHRSRSAVASQPCRCRDFDPHPQFARWWSRLNGSEARTDEHRLDNLHLEVGAEVDPRSAWLEVASNGQQFTSDRVPFVYNAPHAVSSFFPERGPELGATQVVVSGVGFLAGSLDHGHRLGG